MFVDAVLLFCVSLFAVCLFVCLFVDGSLFVVRSVWCVLMCVA